MMRERTCVRESREGDVELRGLIVGRRLAGVAALGEGDRLPAPLQDRVALDVDLDLLGDRRAVVLALQVEGLPAALGGDAELVLGASPRLPLPAVGDAGLAVRLLGPVLDGHGGRVGRGERPARRERHRQQGHGRHEPDRRAEHGRPQCLTGPMCYGKNQMSDVRIDKWLWAARFFKSRTLAAAACGGGKVHVNGDAAKPSKTVRPGDLLRVTLPRIRRIIRVTALAERRGGAIEAAALYDDLTPPPPPREGPPGPAGLPPARRGTSHQARAPPHRPPGRLVGLRRAGCAASAPLLRSGRPRCPGGPPGAGPREGGVNPPRPRHCNRGRNPRSATDPARAGSGRCGE